MEWNHKTIAQTCHLPNASIHHLQPNTKHKQTTSTHKQVEFLKIMQLEGIFIVDLVLKFSF